MLADLAAAPTMGVVAKVNYSHLDMIDYILAHPGASLKDLAARYGYSIGWICNVQASDAWKSAFAARRAELVDPVLAATIAERFEGVTALSLERLREKLEAPQVSDQVVLRAVELGARAMGVGGNPLLRYVLYGDLRNRSDGTGFGHQLVAVAVFAFAYWRVASI